MLLALSASRSLSAHAQVASSPDGGIPAAPAASASAEAEDRIVELRIEGNRRVEREAILRALKSKVGEVFDHEKTAEDLRSLWALNYFTDVQLLIQRTSRPGVFYVVRVVERPALREVRLE